MGSSFVDVMENAPIWWFLIRLISWGFLLFWVEGGLPLWSVIGTLQWWHMNKGQPLNKGQVTTIQACYVLTKLSPPPRSNYPSIVATDVLKKWVTIIDRFHCINKMKIWPNYWVKYFILVLFLFTGSAVAQPYTILQAKALATTAIDILCQPELLSPIQEDFKAALATQLLHPA